MDTAVWECHLRHRLPGRAAVVVDEAIYQPLTAKRAPHLYMMVASIGVSMVLRHIIYGFAHLNGLLNVKARVLLQPVMFVGYGTVTNVYTYSAGGFCHACSRRPSSAG